MLPKKEINFFIYLPYYTKHVTTNEKY